jgi:chorismate synthase
MAGNSIGTIFSLTTFGESHGESIGGIIDGCPAGFQLDLEAIQYQLDRRKPGQSEFTTQRQESDIVRFHSGLFEGKTTGTPIGFSIQNKDQRSKDYTNVKETYRPSHADYTYDQKYGFRDYRGGGRSSARETACRVVAGAIAQQFLADIGIHVHSYVSQVGEISVPDSYQLVPEAIDQHPLRCPDSASALSMEAKLNEVKELGDTVGGVISTQIIGMPAGLGEPVFDKLHADLGKAMLSINAVKGFELGSGFRAAAMLGSHHNDAFTTSGNNITTTTNNSGGIQGGISNGQIIAFRTAFKPVATIQKEQETINQSGETTKLTVTGRHDPCVVPRAVPIVDAMAALTIFDHYLRNQTTQWRYSRD